VIHTRMVVKLAEVKQERNAALLKVIEKDGAIGRLSEQLQSKCQILAPSSPFPCTRHNSPFLLAFQRPGLSWSSRRCPGSRMHPP
jgi:hypothetical protein